MTRIVTVATLVLSARLAAAWVDTAVHQDVAYLASAAPPVVLRYDMAATTWLAPIPLANAPTALAAGDAGLFIAYGPKVTRRTLAGTGEVTLVTLIGTIDQLILADYLIAHRGADVMTIDPVSGAIVADRAVGISGLSYAPVTRRLFGRTGGSPGDVATIAIGVDGAIGDPVDSPYHGDYPNAVRTFVVPDESRVGDDAGVLYAAGDLTFAGSLAGRVDAIAFHGDDAVVLRGRTLHAYDPATRELGRFALSGPADAVFVHDDVAYAFTDRFDGTGSVTAAALAAFALPPPGATVDPHGLAYVPDELLQRTDGTVFVLSRAHRSVFRWRTDTGYGTTIALAEAPDHAAYWPAVDRIVLAYPGGALRQIALGTGDAEASLGSILEPCGLLAASEYLVACDGQLFSTSSLRTLGADGTLLDERGAYARNEFEYVWSPAIRALVYPWSFGTIGLVVDPLGHFADGPTSDAIGTRPYRISPDGARVLTGNGAILDGTTLEPVGALAADVVDGAWLDDTAHTVRALDPFTVVEAWSGPSFALARRVLVPGAPLRVLAADGLPVVVTDVGGVPQWTVIRCGDGIRGAGESCDGADLGGRTCAGLGLGDGTLACSAACSLDTTGCAMPAACGDGVVDRTDELCDGTDFGAVTVGCTDLGFAGGTPRCTGDCNGFDTSGCTRCGNGVLDAEGEECDGADLGGRACEYMGFTSGTLACRSNCTVDTSGCITTHDCSALYCDDDDPCTVDGCTPEAGCTTTPVEGCQPIRGETVERIPRGVCLGGGRCAPACRLGFEAGLVVAPDGTYRILPPRCQSLEGPLDTTDERGRVVAKRGGREQLRVETPASGASGGQCLGAGATVLQHSAWMRRGDDGTVLNGRSVTVAREAGVPHAARVRRETRFGGPGQAISPPRRTRRLPACEF